MEKQNEIPILVKLNVVNPNGVFIDTRTNEFLINEDELLSINIGEHEYVFDSQGKIMNEGVLNNKNLTLKNIIEELQRRIDVYREIAKRFYEGRKGLEDLEFDGKEEVLSALFVKQQDVDKKADDHIKSIAMLRSSCSHNYPNGQSALISCYKDNKIYYKCQICGYETSEQ